MLSLQNPNGGFASYENTRGPQWLELLYPAEVFSTWIISSLTSSVCRMWSRSHYDRTQLSGVHDFSPHSTCHLQETPRVSSDRHRVGSTLTLAPSAYLMLRAQELPLEGDRLPPPSTTAQWRLDRELGGLFHPRRTVRAREFVSCRRNIRNE